MTSDILWDISLLCHKLNYDDDINYSLILYDQQLTYHIVVISSTTYVPGILIWNPQMTIHNIIFYVYIEIYIHYIETSSFNPYLSGSVVNGLCPAGSKPCKETRQFIDDFPS